MILVSGDPVAEAPVVSGKKRFLVRVWRAVCCLSALLAAYENAEAMTDREKRERLAIGVPTVVNRMPDQMRILFVTTTAVRDNAFQTAMRIASRRKAGLDVLCVCDRSAMSKVRGELGSQLEISGLDYRFARKDGDPASAIDSYLESHKGKLFVVADTVTATSSGFAGRRARANEGAEWTLFLADRAA